MRFVFQHTFGSASSKCSVAAILDRCVRKACQAEGLASAEACGGALQCDCGSLYGWQRKRADEVRGGGHLEG